MNDEQRGEPIYMVNTRLDETYIQERVMQHVTHIIKKELGYEKFDFHSLRHTHATERMEDQSVEVMNGMHGCPERPSGDDRWRGFRVAK